MRQAFTQRRKTLANALAGTAALPEGYDAAALLREAGIDGRRRPETLLPNEWVTLAQKLGSSPQPSAVL